MADYSKPKAATEPVATKSVSVFWHRTRMFDPEKIRQLTKTPLPIKLRLMLKLRRKFYASEENMTITYKDYKGVRYILSIKETKPNATLSNLEGDLGSSHMQGTPKAQGHEADNLSEGSAR